MMEGRKEGGKEGKQRKEGKEKRGGKDSGKGWGGRREGKIGEETRKGRQ